MNIHFKYILFRKLLMREISLFRKLLTREISDSIKHSFLFEVKYFNFGPVVRKAISANTY